MMLGAAMETIVWSMKVIETANIIAARATVWWGGAEPEAAGPVPELSVMSAMVECSPHPPPSACASGAK